MRSPQFLLMFLLIAGGCKSSGGGRAVKVDNPVMGEAPPRRAVAGTNTQSPTDGPETADVERSGEPRFDDTRFVKNPLDDRDSNVNTAPTTNTASRNTNEISLTDFNDRNQRNPVFNPDDLTDNQVVATVNGMPLFASEVLQRYNKNLVQAQQKLPPKQFRKLRDELLKRDLRQHIERKIVTEALKASLKPKQMERLDEYVDTQFEKEIVRLKKELKVDSLVELDDALTAQGTSLATLKQGFASQRMASEFLGAKVQDKREITRPDMLKYYQSHLDDYAVASRVRWRQIVVDHAKHGGKRGTIDVLDQLIAELKKGADFADVARRYSDGPTASEGGAWDWTEKGHLANTDIEKALFELPLGKISLVFEDKDSYQIVQVTERQQSGRVAFADVQDDIKKTLKMRNRNVALKKALDDLYAAATVETIFDDDPQADVIPQSATE